VTLHKATQGSVTVTAPGNVTYGTPGTATATGGNAGAFSFSVGASTGCAVVGDQVSVSDATLTCALTATRAGDNNYEGSAASASFPVTLHKATQGSVTVTAPGNVTSGTTGTATATSGNVGSFSFSVGASTGCAVVGDQVSVSDATLTCALTATRAGDNNYEGSAASASFPVTIHKATQGSVTVTAPGNVTYGTPGTATATGGNAGAFSFSVGASTGCAVVGDQVSVSDATLTCALTATRAGDNNYEGSAASASFPVT